MDAPSQRDDFNRRNTLSIPRIEAFRPYGRGSDVRQSFAPGKEVAHFVKAPLDPSKKDGREGSMPVKFESDAEI